MKITIFNGGGAVDYLFGLVSGLAQYQNDSIEVLDSDATLDLFSSFKNVRYYPIFRKVPKDAPVLIRLKYIVIFYSLQFWYLVTRKPRIIHFQWLDRYKFVDRILLPALARLRGHKVVFTVHNVNAGKRDNKDAFFNRYSLMVLYRLCSHLIVHTQQSKDELFKEFKVNQRKVSVIRHGINQRVSIRGLSRDQARASLNISSSEKVILFFGYIDYYKGLDLLIDSLSYLSDNFLTDFRLVIAGNVKASDYGTIINLKIENSSAKEKILYHTGYIPDHVVEQYFMASDCILLPYREIYQSGVMFMAYTFGLPIVVSDIGNFRNDMISGETGLLISNNTPEEISKTIIQYFNSNLYKDLPETRVKIKQWALKNYSWMNIGNETHALYQSLMKCES